MLMDWKDAFGTGIDSVVGAIVGWLVASLTKVSKVEVKQLKADYDHKHEVIFSKIDSMATKAEMVEMQRQLREDIAALRAAILER